jgi:phenylpyruvate tautomerase PptA (4-oxalocrotonate tautomerase family)
MPLAKIHVVEGRCDEERLTKVSGAIQAALMNTLRVPPEDFYQLIFELPKKRFLHTPSFVGVLYENAAGGATFEYDRPSTLFGQFGDEQVTAVSRELDAELERALRQAAE